MHTVAILEASERLYDGDIEKTLVPCVGGPCQGLGIFVEQPIPLEIRHEGGGTYVLEESGDPDNPTLVYVYAES